MVVSKGIVLALDLGTPLALVVHWLLIWNPSNLKGAPGSFKGTSLTLDLGNLACSRGQLAVDMGPLLVQGLWYPKEPN